ncbi:MAG: hypothetical protein CM15mP120_16450 [Pseudomonadota bacterium]|nr:MAG: hypothetical protein CM15mP120_16450 [Pseudomonadota bacterium]
MLIDDDPSIHELVKRTLSKVNINLIGATDGERGLQIIRDKKPGLILLDVYMSGRDGWSTFKIKTDDAKKDVRSPLTQRQEKISRVIGCDGFSPSPSKSCFF